LLLTLLLAWAVPGHAQPRSLPLDPAHAEIGFRAYAFGLVPLDGTFSRFSGVLTIDPRTPESCRVDVSVDVTSLTMPDPAIRDDVLSVNLLDAASFPTLSYSGACRGETIEGTLTLHGASHKLRLSIVNGPTRYTAEGTLRRRDWGVTGRPLMCGPTVRIRVSTTIIR
jgi:polyisoprenoid-binding protein YceI